MSSQSNAKPPANNVAYAVSLALAGGYAPGAMAQEQSVDLEEVIVTSRKREETMLDIPQEIQAISQQQLERANLNSRRGFLALRAEPQVQCHRAGPQCDLLPWRGG